jgi:hypothetical protein
MKVNPGAGVRVQSFLGLPVLFVEDFYADPEAVREAAINARYDLSIAQYPGRHAPIPPQEVAPVTKAIAAIATRLGDRVYRPEDFHSDFSIVTTKPGDLLPTQQHPHIDPTPVLGLVYLTPGSDEGTSFYFNEMLGIAVITTEQERHAHIEFIQRHGAELAPGGYDFTGHRVWRRLYTIEPVFNRFVLYPGNIFHAIDIKRIDEKLDMQRVRVTQRFIVQSTHKK